MKKILMLSLILLLCVGCSRIDNTKDYDVIVDTIINGSEKRPNTTSLGYKYYLPIGVSKIYDKDYNQKLKMNNTYLYLYVDSVSYYYRNSLNFDEVETGSYYYKRISNAEKIGYIKITKSENKYFVKIIYNYAKIETYSSEKELNSVIANSLIILDSIDYNDNLIKKILEDEYYTSIDKEYQINKPENTKSKFSEYLSEYVGEEEQTVQDLPEY